MANPIMAAWQERLRQTRSRAVARASEEASEPERLINSFARIREVDLHWAELGEGPPLLLLHGLCDSHRTWFPVVPSLARSRRVLMLDLAGHGESSRPDASYSLDWHANLVGEWLAHLGLYDVDVVGHSYGGGVAQWMLLHHRSRVRRLGLESAGGLGREVAAWLRWASFPFVVERFGQPFMPSRTTHALENIGGAFSAGELARLAEYNGRPGTARAFSRTVRDVVDHTGQHRHFLDRAREVPSLPPIAVFWGDKDPLIPVGHGIAAVAQLEGAMLTRFPDVGHFPHRQAPERFTQALQEFLDATDLPPARLLTGGSEREGRFTR